MQTIKTAFVVILLMGVLYGVYVALNTPEAAPPPEVADSLEEFGEFTPPQIEMNISGAEVGMDSGMTSPAADAYAPTGQPGPGASAAMPPSATGTSGAIEGYTPPPFSGAPAPTATPAPGAAASTDFQPAKPGVAPPAAPTDLNMSKSADGGYILPKPPAVSGVASAAPAAPAAAKTPTPGSTSSEGGSSAYIPRTPPTITGTTVPPAATADVGTPAKPSADNTKDLADMKLEQQGLKVVRNPYVSGQVKVSSNQPNSAERTAQAFARALKSAEQLREDGRHRQALQTLTVFYGSPDLDKGDQTRLLKELDGLAGRVIYSREHHLEDAYAVGKYETLEQIATKFEVPPRLLMNINGIRDPNVLTPGSKMKVVRGPFRAEVDLDSKQITLFLKNLYAGRFDFEPGTDPNPVPGKYVIQHKQVGRTYISGDGSREIPGGHPANPYGQHWMSLGEQLCIHGSSSNTSPQGLKGCIGLSPRDAADLYAILSKGSEVTITR